ncbi:hypothetical protein PG5_06920 [Pseudomonas sp. G5(2012)]|nr:hypothetical protein PG5_06920 [Pseudomonas sp. G5(2012)]
MKKCPYREMRAFLYGPIFAVHVMPSSRAGSLPQGIFGVHKIRVHLGQLWERACSRRRPSLQH